MKNEKTKSAFVALVGRPNVGKSTLLNHFVGEKVAIVSNRPQTTRNRITGVITKDDMQLVFLDTPGWHQSRNRLGDFMIKQVKESLADIEVAIMITEAFGSIKEEELELLKNLKLRKLHVILALNKVDSLKQKELMIPKIQEFAKLYDFDEIIPISAQTGEGTDVLMEHILSYAKPSPHFFDPDSYTDQPERVIVAEIIREKLLRNLWEELPHGLAVEIESMKERENQDLMDIDAVIICEKSSHKGMIIGKGGAMLKRIGSQSRSDLEKFLGLKINLQLWVKVKEDWRNRDSLIRQLGFE